MKRTLALSALIAVGLARQGVLTAESPAPSAEASWRVLEGCLDDARLDPDSDLDFAQRFPRMQECGEAAETIVRSGTDADRERLWSVFDALPARSELTVNVLDAFLDWHVQRAVAVLERSPEPAASEPTAEAEFPAFLRDASADLRQAWREYQAALQNWGKLRERRSDGDTIAFQSNEAAFRRLAAALLRERVAAAEAVGELSRYEWVGWCGTGSDRLYVPQAKALVIAYLRLGRVDLAVAASGGIDGLLSGAPEPLLRWDRRLLTAAGIDWERFYVGGVLSDQASMADTLARHGSERAAGQLLAAARIVEVAREQDRSRFSDGLLWPLAALVEPGDACAASRGSWDSREIERSGEAEPIGGALQQEILELLAEKVEVGAGLDEADAASHLLAQRCRPESRPAFRAMLHSPYDEVRKRGAMALRALGETVDDPRPSLPVAFRIVVDGKPVARRKVQWTLQMGEWSQSSSTEADDQGVVRLERDVFLDPRRRLTAVRLGTPELTSAGDEWFEVSLAPPTDLDAVSTVSVGTASLTVIVPRSLLGSEGRRPTLQLRTETSRYGVDAIPSPVSADLPVESERITFPRLQHGRYQVWLVRDGTLYASPTVEVGQHPATVTISERSLEEELATYGWTR